MSDPGGPGCPPTPVVDVLIPVMTIVGPIVPDAPVISELAGLAPVVALPGAGVPPSISTIEPVAPVIKITDPCD